MSAITSAPWPPVLTGGLAEKARERVIEIAQAVERHEPLSPNDPSLAGGYAGIALFYGYLATEMPGDGYLALAERYLTQALDSIAVAASCTAGLFTGFVGAAWVNQHLTELLSGGSPRDLNADADEMLVRLLEARPYPGRFDLIYGLAGFGRYALDHSDRPFGTQLSAKIVALLLEMAERGDGLRWRAQNETEGVGSGARHDLGMAHGAAGVVAFLAEYLGSLDTVDADLSRLLRQSVGWLHRQQRPQDGGSRFPYFSELTQISCRSGWCYGDLSISAATIAAASVLGADSWHIAALEWARNDGARPFDATGVVDSGLCHGSAGIAHMLNRLYHRSREGDLAELARSWYTLLLSSRQDLDEAVAGYASWWPETAEWKPDPGFLCGIAGIGLALLAGYSTVAPSWDRLLLLSSSDLRRNR